jgi:hypothetical protein
MSEHLEIVKKSFSKMAKNLKNVLPILIKTALK